MSMNQSPTTGSSNLPNVTSSPAHPPPSLDAWYRPPSSFITADPGSILRLRAVPEVNLTAYENCAAAYHVMFATRNSLERSSWGVTTLVVPERADGGALLSYQIPYNTVSVDASPSYMFLRLLGGEHGNAARNIEEGLRRGWHVNFPDFEGPHAAFGDTVTQAYTLLDSIRAVLRCTASLSPTGTRVALWGFSGGALASCWAAQFQPRHAPELNCVGAVLGAIPSACGFLERLSGTRFAALLPIFLIGASTYYPDVRDHVLSELKENRKDEFLSVLGYPIEEAFRAFDRQVIWDYFRSGHELLHHPLIRDRLVRCRLGYDGVPRMPLFFHKAVGDELTPIADTDDLVEKWRCVDVNILYERNTVGGHLDEAVNGRSRAISWLEDVLNGEYTHRGVTVRDVTVGLSSGP